MQYYQKFSIAMEKPSAAKSFDLIPTAKLMCFCLDCVVVSCSDSDSQVQQHQAQSTVLLSQKQKNYLWKWIKSMHIEINWIIGWVKARGLRESVKVCFEKKIGNPATINYSQISAVDIKDTLIQIMEEKTAQIEQTLFKIGDFKETVDEIDSIKLNEMPRITQCADDFLEQLTFTLPMLYPMKDIYKIISFKWKEPFIFNLQARGKQAVLPLFKTLDQKQEQVDKNQNEDDNCKYWQTNDTQTSWRSARFSLKNYQNSRKTMDSSRKTLKIQSQFDMETDQIKNEPAMHSLKSHILEIQTQNAQLHSLVSQMLQIIDKTQAQNLGLTALNSKLNEEKIFLSQQNAELIKQMQILNIRIAKIQSQMAEFEIKQDTPNYYINPLFYKSKADDQLLEQIIELESEIQSKNKLIDEIKEACISTLKSINVHVFDQSLATILVSDLLPLIPILKIQPQMLSSFQKQEQSQSTDGSESLKQSYSQDIQADACVVDRLILRSTAF